MPYPLIPPLLFSSIEVPTRLGITSTQSPRKKVTRESTCTLPPPSLSLLSQLPECMSVSCSVLFDSLRPHRLQPARLLCPWDSPGKNTGMGCHALLQGIFPTQGSNPGLLHRRRSLCCLSHSNLRVNLFSSHSLTVTLQSVTRTLTFFYVTIFLNIEILLLSI